MDDINNIIPLKNRKKYLDFEATYKALVNMDNLSYDEEENLHYFLQNSEQQLVNTVSESLFHSFCDIYYKDSSPPLYTYLPLKLKAYRCILPKLEQWIDEMKIIIIKQEEEIQRRIKQSE